MSAKGITYEFIWHAEPDACEQCARLNGKKWTGQDLFQNTLYDQFDGDIWDLNIDFPLTHGGTGAHCRCTLETRVIIDWEEIEYIKKLSELSNALLLDVSEANESTVSTKPSQNTVEELTDVGQIQELRDNISQLKGEISGMSMGYHELREFETLLNRTLNLIEQTSGDKNVKKYAQDISRLITLVRMLQNTIRLAQLNSGPIGWALLGISTVMTISATEATFSDIIRGTS